MLTSRWWSTPFARSSLTPCHSSSFMERKTKRALSFIAVLVSFLGFGLLFFGWDIKGIPVLLIGIAMIVWELWYLFVFKNES